MDTLSLENPFGAPIYHLKRTASTMADARLLAADPETSHGTVICADYQSEGRGRLPGRQWVSMAGDSLIFTIILKFSNPRALPAALPLRIGLAVTLAIEDLYPSLRDKFSIKWPNDLLIGGKKFCGILCEGDTRNINAGIGINLIQSSFPEELSHRATSLALAQNGVIPNRDRVLEAILHRLAEQFMTGNEDAYPWKKQVERRLYKCGQKVRFREGRDDRISFIEGIVAGIGNEGELLLQVGKEKKPRRYMSGELVLFSY